MNERRFFQPLVLATVLAFGVAFVWGVVGQWVSTVIGENRPDEEHGQLSFLADGDPRVTVFSTHSHELEYRDLDGNTVSIPMEEKLDQVSLPAVLHSNARTAESTRDQLCTFRKGTLKTEYWYFVTDGQIEGNGYFVGYDKQSKACIGYLGTGGVRQAPLPKEELIPGTLARIFSTGRRNIFYNGQSNEYWSLFDDGELVHDLYVLGRDQKIYHANLFTHTVEALFVGQRLCSIGFLHSVNDSKKEKPRLVARTDDTVLVFDKHDRVHRRYPIPEELHGLDFAFSETTTGEAIMHWVSPMRLFATRTEHRIFWITSDGQVRKAETSLLTIPFRPSIAAVVAPSPILLVSFIGLICATDNFATTPGEALTKFWPDLTIFQLIAVAFAVLCSRRQVRYGASSMERLIWPLFVLIFGLPGWLGYRFGRSWPVLEACPTCEAVVPHDREACVSCANDFPRPALKGTEVFA